MEMFSLKKTMCIIGQKLDQIKYGGAGLMLYLVAQSCLTLCNPMDYPSGASDQVDSPGKNTGVGCHAHLQGNLPNPGIEPRSPTLQADSSLSEPPGKPMNIGVGNLSLLQRTFSTLELNQGLLHCRRILYQPSYRRSPAELVSVSKNDRKADLIKYETSSRRKFYKLVIK